MLQDNLGFTCGNNGEVFLPFGSAEYVGLGFSVFGMLVVIEMFGYLAPSSPRCLICLKHRACQVRVASAAFLPLCSSLAIGFV